ncbi:hypothetical protein Q7P35_012173 [Cladosporium inversicolor]
MRLLSSTFLCACLCVLHAVHAAEYGVGFGLTIDYGVASVYYRNGSIVNVAKIEGTPNYKTTMKAAAHVHANVAASLTDSNAIVDSDYCDCYRAWDHVPRHRSSMQYYLTLIQEYFPRAIVGMRHYSKMMQAHLPPWMGGPETQTLDASAQSFADMLRVLKFATEAYLGAEIPNAAVSVPFPVGRGRVHSSSLEARLDAAASTVKLKLAGPFEAVRSVTSDDRKAKRFKRKSHTYYSCHNRDDTGVVLGIDFDAASLTATIQAPDCSGDIMYYDTKRVLHSTELGRRELFKADNWHDVLVSALRDVTALPTKGEAETDQINMLMLLGDSARDERLHLALKDVLGEQYDRLIASVRDDGTPARDPQFRGAASAAHNNWYKNCHRDSDLQHGCSGPEPDPWWFGPIVHYRVKEAREAVREWFRSAAEKEARARMVAKRERKRERRRLIEEFERNPKCIGPP